MPAPHPVLARDDARRIIAARGFDCASDAPPAWQVGIELEWLVVCLDDPRTPAPHELVHALADAVGPLPGGSRITFEPGGQIELSSPPSPLDESCDGIARDIAVIGDALARGGVGMVALGLEPGPGRDRAVRSSRYDAMEVYFDAGGLDGRRMMRSTAGAQVNLDFGDPIDGAARWQVAHDIGPMLAAAFANSPFGADGPSGLRSTRLDVWSRIDRTRTAPVDGAGAAEWAEYALAAGVMLVQTSAEQHESVWPQLTFDDWIATGHALGWPTVEDLEYHLTTLFPPVRPRGWLELRMLDALPDPWWRVAVAVTTALVQEQALRDSIARAARPTRELWDAASRDALSHPGLANAARVCFAGALESLRATGVESRTVDRVEEFVDRYVARGRCPADDLLDRWRLDGAVIPAPENAPEVAWT